VAILDQNHLKQSLVSCSQRAPTSKACLTVREDAYLAIKPFEALQGLDDCVFVTAFGGQRVPVELELVQCRETGENLRGATNKGKEHVECRREIFGRAGCDEGTNDN
jgi:hypothetical protein